MGESRWSRVIYRRAKRYLAGKNIPDDDQNDIHAIMGILYQIQTVREQGARMSQYVHLYDAEECWQLSLSGDDWGRRNLGRES